MTRHKFDNRGVFRKNKPSRKNVHDQKRVDRVARIFDPKEITPAVMGSDHELEDLAKEAFADVKGG